MAIMRERRQAKVEEFAPPPLTTSLGCAFRSGNTMMVQTASDAIPHLVTIAAEPIRQFGQAVAGLTGAAP